jgi:hypothetical protein
MNFRDSKSIKMEGSDGERVLFVVEDCAMFEIGEVSWT